MKKTQIIELFSNIRATFMSFFAIMLFVVLSVGVFAGISWTSPALQRSADEIFDEGRLYDIEIQFPNGLTEENIESIKAIDGVDELEIEYTSLQMLQNNDKEYVTKVMSLTDGINMPVNVDGSLPEAPGEIALNRKWADAQGISTGDTVTFKHDGDSDDKDGMAYLTCDTYKVTAIVDSPAYISYNLSSYGLASIGSGYIQCLAFTASESFDASAYPGYVQAFIRSDSLRGLSTADSRYKEAVQELADEITVLGGGLAEERYNSIMEEGRKRIKEGEDKLAAAKKRIENGEKQIEAGKKKLKDARAQYNAGKKKLDAGYATLTAKQNEYDEAKRKYDKSFEMYSMLKLYRDKLADDTLTFEDIKELDRQLETYSEDEDMQDSEQLSEVKKNHDLYADQITEDEWNESKPFRDMYRVQALGYIDPALAEMKTELREAKKLLNESKKKLDAGWDEYYKGAAKLREAKQQIAEGEALLAKKIKELEAAKKKYREGLKALEAFKKKLSKVKDYDWTVLTRESNGGLMVARQFCDLTDNLRFSMAALFIIIGLLVSYSSVSRIVRDQIISIGTKKALGLRRREITCSYLAYSGTAVFIGGIIGLLLGTLGIERILAGVIGKRFIMGTYSSYFSPVQGALLIAAEMGLILLTTWLACRSVLKQQAVELLKGEKPPMAKPRFFESWMLWKRLPLLTKTVVNNCINDKRRVFGTLIGIAGCTALIVTAVTVNNNIQKSFTRQYDEVYSYNAIVRYNAKVENGREDILKVLGELNVESTSVYSSPFRIIKTDGNQAAVTVTVPLEDDFDSFVHINSSGKASDEEYSDGIWISKAYNVHSDAEVGDIVQIMDSEGQTHPFTIRGFFDHYLFSNQIVMSPEVYEAGFEKKAAANAFLADTGELSVKEVKSALEPVEAVRMVKDDYNASFDMFDEFSTIAGAVVVVYLVLSVLMAIIVLFDLYTVFIEEKKKELIILMINGFSLRDARQYIYRDAVALTVIGIILGVIFGVVMGNVTLMTLEPDKACFVKGIDWAACGFGAAASGILAIVLCWLALRRISHFKLSDINKL